MKEERRKKEKKEKKLEDAQVKAELKQKLKNQKILILWNLSISQTFYQICVINQSPIAINLDLLLLNNNKSILNKFQRVTIGLDLQTLQFFDTVKAVTTSLDDKVVKGIQKCMEYHLNRENWDKKKNKRHAKKIKSQEILEDQNQDEYPVLQ